MKKEILFQMVWETVAATEDMKNIEKRYGSVGLKMAKVACELEDIMRNHFDDIIIYDNAISHITYEIAKKITKLCKEGKSCKVTLENGEIKIELLPKSLFAA